MEDDFPYWSRLHLYWRTNPYYNKFYDSPSKAPNKGSAIVGHSLPKTTAGLTSGIMTRKRKLEDSDASASGPGASKNNPRVWILFKPLHPQTDKFLEAVYRRGGLAFTEK